MTVAWNVLSALLRGLSALSMDPAWGPKGEALTRILALGALALERGEAGRADLEALCAEIDTMVAQGRDPTAAEWGTLRGRSEAAHEKLQKIGDADPGDSEGGAKD